MKKPRPKCDCCSEPATLEVYRYPNGTRWQICKNHYDYVEAIMSNGSGYTDPTIFSDFAKALLGRNKI